MKRHRRRWGLTAATAFGLVVVGWMGGSRAQGLLPAPAIGKAGNGVAKPGAADATPTELEPVSSSTPSKAASLTLAKGANPSAAPVESLQLSLESGPPPAVAELIAKVNSDNTKSRVTFTPLVKRALARALAKKIVGGPAGSPMALTSAGTRALTNSLTEPEFRNILAENFKTLTGLTPPKDIKAEIGRQNSRALTLPGGRALTLSGGAPGQPTPNLPTFNWTQLGVVTAAKDQDTPQSCGCCWAFATIGTYEAAYALANRKLIDASEQLLINCAPGSMPKFISGYSWDCVSGGWWGFDMLWTKNFTDAGTVDEVAPFQYQGAVDSSNCPGSGVPKKYLITNWNYVVPNGADLIPTNDQLKQALCDFGPLAVAVFGFPEWGMNNGDVLHDFPNDPTRNPAVNHAIVLVGWDDTKEAWLFKNSWGAWGIPAKDQSGTLVGSGFGYLQYNNNNLGYGAAYVVPATGN